MLFRLKEIYKGSERIGDARILRKRDPHGTGGQERLYVELENRAERKFVLSVLPRNAPYPHSFGNEVFHKAPAINFYRGLKLNTEIFRIMIEGSAEHGMLFH